MKAMVVQGDLTTGPAMTALFADAKAAMGQIDLAVNIVGMVLKKPIVETTDEELDMMLNINAKAAYYFLRECGKHVADNGKVITVVTSLLGAFTPCHSTYAGSKATVEHFTRAAAKEFGARGVSVNTVGPDRCIRHSFTARKVRKPSPTTSQQPHSRPLPRLGSPTSRTSFHSSSICSPMAGG